MSRRVFEVSPSPSTCAHYDLSPDDYRARWNLLPDYPMVAPSYAAARSELAKKMGLGQQRAQKGRKPRKK